MPQSFRTAAFHDFLIVEVPLYDELSGSIHMDMPRRVVTFPPDKNVPAAAEFAHMILMLPLGVTLVNGMFSLVNGFEVTSRIDLASTMREVLSKRIQGRIASENRSFLFDELAGKLQDFIFAPSGPLAYRYCLF